MPRMLAYTLLVLCTAAEPFPDAAAEAEVSAAITERELKAHVYRLASPEFLGRKGPGGQRAADHIAELFRKAGLAPAFGESYFQQIPWNVGDKGGFVGKNVAAMIPGSDPTLRDEWVLLSAHYDHLGVKNDKLYPGADDNAAAVAMLVEVAEAFVRAPTKPKRTILFVSFDLEEQGLQGSTHFAAHPPLPLSKLKTFVTADLLGRAMAGVMDEYVFVLGSESSPALRKLLADVPPEDGLKVGRLGADLVGTRSDYGPFRDRKVPFLFLTTGTHADYHRPTDLPDKIDYPKLTRISRWAAALTTRLADDPAGAPWQPTDATDLEEAKTTQMLLGRVLERPTAIPMSEAQRESVRKAHDRLTAIVGRGKVTPEERTWLVWTARALMLSVF